MAIDDNELLPVNAPVKHLAASNVTEVGRLEDTGLVIKERTLINCDRSPGETDEAYYARRLENSFKQIRDLMEENEKSKEFIPKTIQTPQEYYFIAASAKDGFPTPFRVQKEVEGDMLRNIKLSDLNEEAKTDLITLIQASFECDKKYGHHLDIAGSCLEDSFQKFEIIKRMLRPLENSSNIFITPDGKIALIDMGLDQLGPSKTKVAILRGFRFIGLFWDRIRLRNEN